MSLQRLCNKLGRELSTAGRPFALVVAPDETEEYDGRVHLPQVAHDEFLLVVAALSRPPVPHRPWPSLVRLVRQLNRRGAVVAIALCREDGEWQAWWADTQVPDGHSNWGSRRVACVAGLISAWLCEHGGRVQVGPR